MNIQELKEKSSEKLITEAEKFGNAIVYDDSVDIWKYNLLHISMSQYQAFHLKYL